MGTNATCAPNTSAAEQHHLPPEDLATILLAVVAFHVPLLLGLSARQRRSGNRVLRSLHWGVSAAYFPLMTYVLSFLTGYIPTAGRKATGILVLVVLVQFLRAKADMAALAVAAVASPAAGDDDVNGLKIRPSVQSFINTFWVVGLVVYKLFSTGLKKQASASACELPWPSPSPSPWPLPPLPKRQPAFDFALLIALTVLISPLWILGACRTVVRFAAFQRARNSFALGRNVQLIDGYMLQLREEQESGGYFAAEAESETSSSTTTVAVAVPRLIVTGERDQDVVESPLGYHVKRSSLQGGEGTRLVTLDRVWSLESHSLQQWHKDLCLSFALFKCLRRRFSGYRLAAEAGGGGSASASWAFRLVSDGLLAGILGNDPKRIFTVIATELSFASDYFHSPLPVASMGTATAALHFLFSLIILPSLLLLAVALVLLLNNFRHLLFYNSEIRDYLLHKVDWLWYPPWVLLALVLTLVIAGVEIEEMVVSVRSNWTKISIIGHLVRSRHGGARRFLACLLKCKAPEFWDDEIGQTQMLKPDFFVVQQPCPCACSRCRSGAARAGAGARVRQLMMSDDPIRVPVAVKEAILRSLRGGGGHLSDGTEAIRRHAFRRSDITWACRDGGGVVTTTDAILVWHVATSLFDMKTRSRRSADSSSAAASPSPPPVAASSNADVARCLSRYCMYLVAEAPDLLPDKAAWVTRRYEDVKKRVEEAPKCSGGDESCVYQHLLDTFGKNSGSHEVLINGAKLGKQLAEEEAAEDQVWELLSEFWSELLLYLAPSDNVKAHIEALQRGGELITLLWALLLHAGITSRPPEYNITASLLLATGDADTIAVHHC